MSGELGDGGSAPSRWTGSPEWHSRPDSPRAAARLLGAADALRDATGAGLGATGPSGAPVVNAPGGFNWGAALIGAAVTAGLFLVGVAGALVARRRGALAH